MIRRNEVKPKTIYWWIVLIVIVVGLIDFITKLLRQKYENIWIGIVIVIVGVSLGLISRRFRF